ncbi:MAG TPA: L-sorbose 1-phosphate reductase [Candidatus Atribacteria bacterium]|nr:L-sorbose 1-phosphate reductase [Candidatus Atribacteria bacterium]
MRTKAVRLYGKNDLRLEEFDLPAMKNDEIIAHIISDSLCMSSYKAVVQGAGHKRVPHNVAENPVIIGHEFCGEIIEVGKKWQHKFKKGQKFAIQPALNYQGSLHAPGYSFPYVGGDATYIIIPNEVMEMDCLLEYKGEAFYGGSLAEPMSCIIGAFHAAYHTIQGQYIHHMGIVKNGNVAILAGAGPMGLGAIDYALHSDRRPKLLVVTDVDKTRLERASSIHTVNEAKKKGVELKYINTKGMENPEVSLISVAQGKKYDDVFVFAPVKEVVEQGDRILSKDGCLNFFAGPSDPEFSAMLNFYNVHYASTHIVGTSGGNTQDMIESLEMMRKDLINPAAMITHIGGLNCVVNTTLNLPKIPGNKKLIYTNIEMELTAISDFKKEGKINPLFTQLAKIVEKSNGLWSAEAEKYLLEKAKHI